MSSTVLRVAILLLAVASCRSQEAISPGQAEVTDSAGVRVVVLSGAIASFAIPEVGLKKAFTVGSDASGIELYRVSGARFLESGQLVIANGGASELLVVDRAGQQIRRFGSHGEGPGQFITITSVHVGEGDTIVTYDDRQGRLTQFDSGGHLLATRRLTDPNPVNDLLPLMCVFRSNPSTSSGAFRPLIPEQGVHRFR